MKQMEKLANQDQQIETKEFELELMTTRIEVTENFVEEVADTAYEQAVKVVAETVREEIRNEDFDFIEEQRRIFLNKLACQTRSGTLLAGYLPGSWTSSKG